MKGRIITVSAIVAAMAFLSVAFAWAAGFTGSQQFNNVFETSGVNVKIDQLCEKNGEIREIESETEIMPGKTVSYIPRVTNMAEECYVRVKFDFRFSGDVDREIGADCIKGESGKWLRIGSCYYCTTPLDPGDQEDVFEAIAIPEELGTQQSTLTVHATVEAIQAKNFTPDFSSAGPWGTVEVKEVYRYTEKSESLRVTSLENMDFTYVKEGTFECETEDLFARFASFQPGDTCSETLEMKNRSAEAMDIFFRTENQKTDLLEEMKLVIKCGNKKVYSGSLASQKLNTFMKIATVDPGDAGELKFQISLPLDADNRYAMLKDNVNWIFAVSEAGSEKSESLEGSRKSSPGRHVKTGDGYGFLAIAALLAVSALAGAAVAIASGRRKGEDDE